MRLNIKQLLVLMLLLAFSSTIWAMPMQMGTSTVFNPHHYTTDGMNIYLEDFATTTYRDASTTASGWGQRGLSNARNFTYEHLSFSPIEYPAYGLAIQGRKAYTVGFNLTSSAYSIHAFDINDPRHVYRMSYRDSWMASYTCEVDGLYMYTGTYDSLNFYNIQNPFNLNGGGVYLGSLYHDGFFATDIDIEGHLIYYTVYDSASNRSLNVAYAENPATPSQIICNWNSNNALGLEVEGDLAYVAASVDGLYILNITDKWSPVELSHFDTPGNATDVILDGHLAYLADGDGGVLIFDVSNSSNPIFLSSYNTLGNVRRMILQEKTLFLADMLGGVVVLDVNNPEHPLRIATLLDDEIVYDVGLFGGILVVTTNNGIHTFRIAANWGIAMNEFTAFPNPFNDFQVWDVRVMGDIAYIAGGPDGFYTLNVRNPANPILLDRFNETGCNPIKLDVEGQFAYCVQWGGVFMFDISDPSNIRLTQFLMGGGLADVDIEGELLYIGFTTGFAICNVSSSYSWSLIVNYIPGTHQNITAISVDGREVYVVEGPPGIAGWSEFSGFVVTTFTAPVLTDTETRIPSHYDVRADGDCCYLGAGGWMSLYNVSNPLAFTYPDWVDIPSYGVWDFGSYVLSADSTDGVALYNATNVENIATIGRYLNATKAYQITTYGDYTYVANRTSLVILRHFMSAGSTFIPGAHVAQSKEIDSIAGVIKSASLYVNQFVPVDTNIVYFMSADGGAHWEPVIPGDLHTFTYTGDDLRWRAIFFGPQYRSAYLYYVEIEYTFNEAPSIPSINSLGGSKFTGIFKVSWTTSTDDVEVDHYQLQMSDSSGFITILKSWNTSKTIQKVTNFSKGPLYFRVCAIDDEGVASTWSTTESVNIKLAASILTIIIVGVIALLLIIVVVFVVIISKKKKKVSTR